MTILWRRITWFAGFVVALLLATWMRHRGFDWPATISASVAACIILPLFISQVWADALAFRRARDFAGRYFRSNSRGSGMTEYERTGSVTDLQAIDQVRAAHVAALNAGDAQACAAQFIDDAVQMPPNAPENVGKSQITSWSQGFLEQFRVHFALTVNEVRVSGEWAFERGNYTIGLTSKAGGPQMQDIGKYITVYQRRGNTWRMARDIWNSNNPSPGM